MCVIILCDKQFPSTATLESAEQMNGHGGGIAWLDQNGIVQYRKALGAKEIQHIITNEARLPAIVHFRIASVGGQSKELCHPFPITDNAELSLSGSADSVLFHNGTWSKYDDILLDSVIAGKVKLPADMSAISDSRTMALLANAYGRNILRLIDGSNKIAVLSKDGIQKFGDGWVSVNSNVCSNDYFERSQSYGVTTYDPYDEYSRFYYPARRGTQVYTASGKKLSKRQRKETEKANEE